MPLTYCESELGNIHA